MRDLWEIIRVRWGHEDGTLMMRLAPLQEKTRELTVSLPHEDREKMVSCKPGGEPQRNPTMLAPWAWTFQPPELSNKLLSFKPPGCGILLCQPLQTNTVSFLILSSRQDTKVEIIVPGAVFTVREHNGQAPRKGSAYGCSWVKFKFSIYYRSVGPFPGHLWDPASPCPDPPEPGLHTWMLSLHPLPPSSLVSRWRTRGCGGQHPGTAGWELILPFLNTKQSLCTVSQRKTANEALDVASLGSRSWQAFFLRETFVFTFSWLAWNTEGSQNSIHHDLDFPAHWVRTATNSKTPYDVSPQKKTWDALKATDHKWKNLLENPPANAGDMGLIPGPGNSHIPWGN